MGAVGVGIGFCVGAGAGPGFGVRSSDGDSGLAVAVGLGAAVNVSDGFGCAVVADEVGDASVVTAIGVRMVLVALDGLDPSLIAKMTPKHAKKQPVTMITNTRLDSQVGPLLNHLIGAIDRKV